MGDVGILWRGIFWIIGIGWVGEIGVGSFGVYGLGYGGDMVGVLIGDVGGGD